MNTDNKTKLDERDKRLGEIIIRVKKALEDIDPKENFRVTILTEMLVSELEKLKNTT